MIIGKTMESDEPKLKKKEKKFLTILIFLTIFLWIGSYFFQKNNCDSIQITVNGEVFGNYSLSENQIIMINNTNVCEIKNSQAVMIQASCPDHLCMKQNPIDHHGGTIVCLPNKVVIEGGISAASDESFPELDAVS